MAFIFKKFYSLYELKAIQLEGVEGGPRPLIQGLRRLQRLRECFEYVSKADVKSDTVEEAD